jgi:hypothetical protein
MRPIKWNKLAKEDYYKNIDYLLLQWSNKEAQNFINDVEEIIFILRMGIVDFQATDYPDIRRCVMSEQITLFYKIHKNESIELLRFWSNNMDIKKIGF